MKNLVFAALGAAVMVFVGCGPDTSTTVLCGVPDAQCFVYEVVDGACTLAPGYDGQYCITEDGTAGVCVGSAECIVPACPGADAKLCGQDSDCYVRECTHSVCIAGECVHGAYADGMRCFTSTANAGTCSDCECIPLACTPGEFVDDVLGDCAALQCQEDGTIAVAAIPTDIPDDANECTVDYCAAFGPAHEPRISGSSCMNGACDGEGHCVNAILPAD